ncbi:MAG: bifunctional methylenetetrahydrofolate dehydrogenase/methenyltetrahydrofolate cyclohydrolase FolD [Candidatus Diapherotrites archaeon]|nr:bifunctional methylenetetrahydrofolate dehydrogenase/methenyltetrahydrofolate cyclohydrolase FolD [Candidatus Diapherotrites archaeon]
MPASIIDGKALAAGLKDKVAGEISSLGFKPRLDVVLVGENPASKVYVKMKNIACEKVGIESVKHSLPDTTTQEELLSLVSKLNADPAVDGVLVQLPLPKQIAESAVIKAIDPAKDVDGFHPVNMGLLLSGQPGLTPSTPTGVIAMLDSINFNYNGAKAVVVGRSNIVGKPLAIMLLQRNCTVTVCHSKTKNLPEETRQADLLIAAAGKPKLITADMVKEDAVVIDVGINRTDSGLCGDVDFDAVKEKASAISPVPGGVGPMTVASLMRNTLEAAKERRK